ncbi:MAG: MarR family winged helix-turn-helix transcriptional regulator [Pseudomonadota bacterium]
MNLDDVVAEVAGSCRATKARIEARRLTRAYDKALADQGLRSTEYAVLVAVGRLGNGRMAEIADLLEMDISTLSRSVTSLAAKGWLVVEILGHRTRRLSLTDSGVAKVLAAYPAWLKAQARQEADRS